MLRTRFLCWCAIQSLADSNENAGLMQTHSTDGIGSQQLSMSLKDTDAQIQQMLSSVSQMEEHVSRHMKKHSVDPEWGPAQRTATTAMKTAITAMMKFLESASSSVQSEWDALVSSFNGCGTAKTQRLNGHVQTKNQRVGELRKLHTACRKSEWTSKDYQHFRTLLKEDSLQPMHAVPVVDQRLCARETDVNTDGAAYINLRPNNQAAADCDEDQRNFENEFCVYYFLRTDVCGLYTQCVNNLDLPGKKTGYLEQEDDFMALWKLLHQLLCRVNRLLTTFDSSGEFSTAAFDRTDTCASEVVDTSNVTLTLTIPPEVPCAATSLARPSTADGAACTEWRNQEYESWEQGPFGVDKGSKIYHVKPTSCQVTCDEDQHATTTTTTPSVLNFFTSHDVQSDGTIVGVITGPDTDKPHECVGFESKDPNSADHCRFTPNWGVDFEQIRSKVKSCTVTIKKDCKGSLMTSGFSHWVNNNNQRFPLQEVACAGGTCDCDQNDETWRSDEGTIDSEVIGMSAFPPKEFSTGDTGDKFSGSGDHEAAKFTVGPLRCTLK